MQWPILFLTLIQKYVPLLSCKTFYALHSQYVTNFPFGKFVLVSIFHSNLYVRWVTYTRKKSNKAWQIIIHLSMKEFILMLKACFGTRESYNIYHNPKPKYYQIEVAVSIFKCLRNGFSIIKMFQSCSKSFIHFSLKHTILTRPKWKLVQITS